MGNLAAECRKQTRAGSADVLDCRHAIRVRMKLKQSQIWKVGENFLRVVKLERLSVDYKEMPSPNSTKGTHHHVTKKEFCRLIKGATLLTDQEIFLAPPR